MTASPQRGMLVRRSTLLVIAVLLCSLAGTNLFLLKQNRTIKAQLLGQVRSLEPRPGSLISLLSGLDSEGNLIVLPITNNDRKTPRKTLLLVFSPTCGICDENWPNWEYFQRGVDTGRYNIIAMNLGTWASKEYLLRHDLGSASLISQLDPKDAVAYGFRLTPQTIVLGPEGRIEKVWTGLLEREDVREIASILGISSKR